MSEPIVFISHFRVKEGRLDALRQLFEHGAPKLKAEKPRTLVFLAYLNEDDGHLTIIHVFSDAESMDVHFEGAADRSRAAYEVLLPVGWEIYGTPSDVVVQAMRQEAESSRVTLTTQREYIAGFLRSAPG
jgi:quinol monooxygenase YgiN